MISFFISFFKQKTISEVIKKNRQKRSISVVKDRCDKMRRKSVKLRASKRRSDGKITHYVCIVMIISDCFIREWLRILVFFCELNFLVPLIQKVQLPRQPF